MVVLSFVSFNCFTFMLQYIRHSAHETTKGRSMLIALAIIRLASAICLILTMVKLVSLPKSINAVDKQFDPEDIGNL